MVEQTLETHLIPSEALDLLLKDDLQGFLDQRRIAVAEQIKKRVAEG
jgi:hypothetical protein